MVLFALASNVFGPGRVSLIPLKSSIFLDVDYPAARRYRNLCKSFSLQENLRKMKEIGIDRNFISGFTIFTEASPNSSVNKYAARMFKTSEDLVNSEKGNFEGAANV